MIKECFEGYCVRIFCENVGGVILPIDCFAILLMIDPMWVMRSFVHLGDFHELSSLTRIHVVSTGSHPKIPPENFEQYNKHSSKLNNKNKLASSLVYFCYYKKSNDFLFLGVFWGGIRYSLHPPTHPPKTPFFPDFSWFSGISGISPIKPTYNWGGPGGGIFPLIFPWI